ncbi:MAG: HAD-IB family hydrolase [Ignavibacteriota bacterium]
MKLILFDFDKTITTADTLLPVSLYLSKELNNRLAFPKIILSFILFRLGLKDEYKFKESIITKLIKGCNQELIEQLILDFYTKNYNKLFLTAVLKIISEESLAGNKIQIISSNFDIFLNPIIKLLPIDIIESTKVEITEGIITGKLLGEICTKDEKARRLLYLKQKFNFAEVIAYGDSTADYEMLRKADKSYLVKIILKKRTEKYVNQIKNLFGILPSSAGQVELKKFTIN